MEQVRRGYPYLGFGVGLRSAHFDYILNNQPAVDWFEIISENFIDSQGWPRYVLQWIAERYPVLMHGVSLSIGSSDPLDFAYLGKLKQLNAQIGAQWISDHLCWTGILGRNTHDLLPVPLNETTLQHVIERIRIVQDLPGRTLHIFPHRRIYKAMDPELERIQRWMQAMITHPEGIQPGMASAQGFNQIEAVVSPSLTLSSAERLSIYSRSYHARLIECFRSIFPALLQALGEQLFDHFVIDYLQNHPPHSYTLGNVADDFPDHLEKTRPDADQPPENRESWPDFIIELAQLELAFIKVYDGPGVEGQTPPNWSNVPTMPAEQLLALCPTLVPGLRFFAFRYPVHNYSFPLSIFQPFLPYLPGVLVGGKPVDI